MGPSTVSVEQHEPLLLPRPPLLCLGLSPPFCFARACTSWIWMSGCFLVRSSCTQATRCNQQRSTGVMRMQLARAALCCALPAECLQRGCTKSKRASVLLSARLPTFSNSGMPMSRNRGSLSTLMHFSRNTRGRARGMCVRQSDSPIAFGTHTCAWPCGMVERVFVLGGLTRQALAQSAHCAHLLCPFGQGGRADKEEVLVARATSHYVDHQIERSASGPQRRARETRTP